MNNLSKEEVLAYDRQYNQHPWHRGGTDALPVRRAEGIYYWDYDGNRYYDMASQLSNVNLGHANPEINQAIIRQLNDYAYMNPAKASAPRSELAKKLVDLAPDNIAKVFFTNAGADANEAAIYTARAYTGRSKILTRYRSYHGATYGSVNLSGDPRRIDREKPAAPGFLKFFDPYVYHSRIPFRDDREASEYYLSQLEEQIIYEDPETIAAVEIEAITGANGVIIPPDGYLQGLRALTRKYGILLICDEVMTGFYRTGKPFAFQNWGIEPDIISFAKGVTSGYVQLGGILFSKEIAEYFTQHPFNFGLTYSGHPLACAAGVANLNYYESHHIEERVNELGKVFGDLLDELKQKHISVGDSRHIGLFGALELVKNKKTREPLVPYGKDPGGTMADIREKLQKNGFTAFGRENNINVAPPLIIREQEIRDAFQILDQVLSYVDRKYAEQ